MKRNRDNRRSRQSSALKSRMRKSKQKSQRFGRGILRDDVEIKRWSPKEGTNYIDIIEYKAGANDPEVEKGGDTYVFEYYVHKNVGPKKKWMLCLADMYEKPCPICEDRQRMIQEGASKEVYKKYFPQVRCMYNVVCYNKGDEKEGVQIWDESHWYSEKCLLDLAYSEDRYGNEVEIEFASSDKELGRTISFKREKAQGPDDFPKSTTFKFERRDYDISENLLAQAKSLDELIKIPTYQEVHDAYYNRGEDDDSESSTSREADTSSGSYLSQARLAETLEDLEDIISQARLDVVYTSRTSFDRLKDKVIAELEDAEPPPREDEDNRDSTRRGGSGEPRRGLSRRSGGRETNRQEPSQDRQQSQKPNSIYNDEQLNSLLDELDSIDNIDELKDFALDEGLELRYEDDDEVEDIKDQIERALEDKFETTQSSSDDEGNNDGELYSQKVVDIIRSAKTMRELRRVLIDEKLSYQIDRSKSLEENVEAAVSDYKDDIPF